MDEKAANRKKSELLMVSKDSLFIDVLGAVTIIIQSVIPNFIISHLLQNLRRLRFHHWGRIGQSQFSIRSVYLSLVVPTISHLMYSCSECHTAVLPLSICASIQSVISKLIQVKSVDGYSMNMRLARWSYNEIRFMAKWGNKRANEYLPRALI